MKIEKAIEILQILAQDKMPPDIDDFNKALDLGISALKVVKSIRPYSNTNRSYSLPGETKE